MTEVNDKISYTLEFNRETGQTEVVKINYTPVPNDPSFNSFVAHDIANNSITGISLTLDQIVGTSTRGKIYTVLTLPATYAKNLYEQHKNGNSGWIDSVEAGISTAADTIVSYEGTKAGVVVGGLVVGAVGATGLAAGSIVVGSGLAIGYATSKVYESTGLKGVVDGAIENVITDPESSLYYDGSKIIYKSDNQTIAAKSEEIAKKLVQDLITGDYVPADAPYTTAKIKVNDDEFSTSKGNNQNITQDKNLFSKDSKLIDKNGNEVSEEAAISITKDKNGKDITITKSDIEVKALDGTTTPLTSIINMKNSMINAISEFVSGGYKDIINVLNDKETMGSWAADAARMLANGEEVDDIVQYIFLKELFNNTIGVTVNDFIKDLAIETLPHGDYAKEAMQDAIAEGTVKNLPPEMQQAIADLLASSEYKIVSGSIISFITTIAFQHDEGLNSNEYTEIAAQAIVSEAIRVSITSGAIWGQTPIFLIR